MAEHLPSEKTPGLLIARKHVLELLRTLSFGKDFSPDQIEEIGSHVLTYGDRVMTIVAAEMERVSDEIILRKYEYLIEYLDNDIFVPLMTAALPRTKNNHRLRKSIVRILKYYGADFSRPPLSLFMEEFHAGIRELAADLVCYVDGERTVLVRLLDDFHYLEPADQVGIVRLIGASLSPHALKVLDMMLRTGVNEVIRATADILGRTKSEEARRILSDALSYLPVSYHELIGRNIRKLEFSGAGKKEYPSRPDSVGAAYVGFPLAYGERHMVLVHDDGDVRHLFFFEIEERWGLNESCRCHFDLPPAELNDLVAMYCDQYYLKEVTLTYAVRIFNDAIRKNYSFESAFPPVFPLIALSLPSYYLMPAKYEAGRIRQFSPLPGNDASLLKASGDIWDAVEFLGWLTEDERFCDIVERWYRNLNDASPRWMDDLLVRKVLREIVIPEVELWKERICALADFLMNISEHCDIIPALLAVERAMVRSVEAMEAIPFLRRMIVESKEMVRYRLGEEEL